LTTRCPSGQQTETSVLNLWKRWIPGALASGIVPDIIIDVNHRLSPSIVKAFFSWNWQCATLNHGDELIHLPISCLQPYQIFFGHYTTADGRCSGQGNYQFGVKLLFGRTVGTSISSDALRKMYNIFLKDTNVMSKKKLHLARHAIPGMMEDMGVDVDAIDGVGHWQGNARCQVYMSKIPKTAVTALAGFYVGEQYHVP
ncbi:hypothetical protein NEOLEDRAFT_1028508, partial [Neolentinus lepideus HHB14362 ss-1]